VEKMTIVRILLALAAHYGWKLQQFDVKNAFLHGDLKEEVFMEPPPDFDKGFSGRVCKLKKALYGLKQSPRVWFDRFSKAMRHMGYLQSRGDHTLFFNYSSGGWVTTLLVYVDDIIVTRNDFEEQTQLKENLSQTFKIKDLGVLKYFMGIEVAYSKAGIFLSQRKYILDLLQETGMLGGKGAGTQVDFNFKLIDNSNCQLVDKGRY